MSEPTPPMESHGANVKSAVTPRTTIHLEPGPKGEGELLLVNFEEMIKKMKPGEKLESDPFEMGNHKFNVQQP